MFFLIIFILFYFVLYNNSFFVVRNYDCCINFFLTLKELYRPIWHNCVSEMFAEVKHEIA